jgi:TetR/AcrR family transcriptional repressor of bet genes
VTTSDAIMSQETDTKPRRKGSREERRFQLIEATIEVLAQNGFARTTQTEVAKKAGLSHGLVSFHFATKEKLLAETLAFLAEEYRQNWMDALDAAPPDAAHQLDALLRADFNPEICTQDRLFAWCAFWGEAQSRPIYQQSCGSNDQQYIEVMEGISARLCAEQGSPFDPILVARILRVTVEGVWLDMITMTRPYSPEEGLRSVYTCAAAFFPEVFDEDGLISGQAVKT